MRRGPAAGLRLVRGAIPGTRRVRGVRRLIGVALLAAAPAGATPEPSLAELAAALGRRLAASHPARTGHVDRVEGARAMASIPGAAIGETLEVLAPEAAGDVEPSIAVSMALLGRARVVELTEGGAWIEPVPPLSPADLAPGHVVRARRGPRRLGVAVSGSSPSLSRAATALRTLLPERVRAHGFLAVDVEAPGALLGDRTRVEEQMRGRELDLLVHVVLALRGTELRAYAEVAVAPGAGTPIAWDLFSVSVEADEQVALLLGDPRTGPKPQLRAIASVPLPARPLDVSVAGGLISVLTRASVLRLRYRDGALVRDGETAIPATLPGAADPCRSDAGFVRAGDVDGDGRVETYLGVNWLRYAYRVGVSGALEATAELVACLSPEGSLTGSFLEGRDTLAGSLAFRPRDGGEPLPASLPFPVLRAVPWEGRHFVVLSASYDLHVLRPEDGTASPLSTRRRTGRAFDVAYDAAAARTVLAATSLATSGDRVTLVGLLPPEQPLGHVDLVGTAEGVALADLDQDGRFELVVAEARGSGAQGLDRLLVVATDLEAAPRLGADGGPAAP